MNRVVLSIFAAAALFALGWAAARRNPPEAGVCALMTTEKLLEHPGIASEWADALRSGDSDEIGRVEGMLRDIRSAHGCAVDAATPAAPRAHPALPPGHPPVRSPSLDDRGTRAVPLFGTPGSVTI